MRAAKRDVVVGVFHDHDRAREAIGALKDAGFSGDDISVLMPDTDQTRAMAAETGTQTMAGTITLVYDYRKRNLQTTLSAIQRCADGSTTFKFNKKETAHPCSLLMLLIQFFVRSSRNYPCRQSSYKSQT